MKKIFILLFTVFGLFFLASYLSQKYTKILVSANYKWNVLRRKKPPK